ncbi:MAG TPA: Fur family transcriptional regulator [Caulobacteraceae bacterium]|jgi:Fur family zinc uptake transcriptional regulator
MKTSCAHDGEAAGLNKGELATALADAEARCVTAEERLTGPRRRVLELLLASGTPVKAYDLIAAFGTEGEAAKPPTVYRALEFLERLGFAHRLESLNAYVACRRSDEGHAAAFLICDCCGATEEFEPEVASAVQRAAGARDYVVERVTLEAHGRCPACR